MDISIVIPCKGRLHHLKQTIASFLSQHTAINYEVIVVDYNCPQNTFQWCKAFDHKTLKSILVKDGEEYFNLSKCRNIGANFAESDIIGIMDADTIVMPDYLDQAFQAMKLGHDFISYTFVEKSKRLQISNCRAYELQPVDCLYEGEDSLKELMVPSFCFVTKEIWHKLRGLDEEFEGWCYQDVDFMFRARKIAQKIKFLQTRFIYLYYEVEESTRFYKIKDKYESLRLSKSRLNDLKRPINPNGYGITNNFEKNW